MTKLNDLQTILLSAASQRDDGSLYPVHADVAGAGVRLDKGIAALIKDGFAEERETNDAACVFRSIEDVAFGLFLTDAGAAAIGIRGCSALAMPMAGSVAAPTSALPKPSKTSAVLALLQRKEGATLPELIAATSWLPHTTRAALTGLRKKGHVVDRRKVDGVTCYRIAGAA